MRILGFEISRPIKLNTEQALAALAEEVSKQSARLFEVEKQANRVERIVYRKDGKPDLEAPSREESSQAVKEKYQAQYGPGDEVPSGLFD